MRFRLLLVTILLSFHATGARARAGGGQSFSSGGSSRTSSSSFSSSRSSSSPSEPFQWACNDEAFGVCTSAYPAIGLMAAILGFMSVVLLLVTRGILRHLRSATMSRKAKARNLAQLRQKDPAFEADAFERRARQAFIAVQKAWNDGDLRSVRAFLSDGSHERLQTLLAINTQLGLVNKTDQLVVDALAIETVACNEAYDNVTVRICASCRDFDQKPDGAVVRDRLTSFAEDWTFVRRATAKTLKAGPIEGQCPSCGSGLEITDRTACAHCQTLLASGAYDWVLSEITQTRAPRLDSAPDFAEAIAALQVRDPQFNAQTVEDRVSSLFWRRRAAEMGSGTECRDIGVGSVQLTMAQSTPLNDVLTFTVVWSAIESGNQCATNLQSQFTLERAIGVQTDAAQGFLSLRCAGCGSGAVGRPDDGDHCAHCGSTLADKSREWVLTLVKENLRQQKKAA